MASLHSIEAFKNKVAPAFQKAEFLIRFDPVLNHYGIDNVWNIVEMAKVAGIVQERGGHFMYTVEGDEDASFKVHGSDALYAHILTHPASGRAIKRALVDQGILAQ